MEVKDKDRQWRNVINRYIGLHKHTKVLGTIAIAQRHVGKISKDLQLELREALKQLNTTYGQLQDLLLPLLTDIDTMDLFPNIITTLENEVATLNTKLQKEFEENSKLREKISKMEEQLKESHMLYTKVIENQVQAEETLKTQDDLICDLKNQLANYIKERDVFETANDDVETELPKQNDVDAADGFSKIHTDDDYHSRATLKIDNDPLAEVTSDDIKKCADKEIESAKFRYHEELQAFVFGNCKNKIENKI